MSGLPEYSRRLTVVGLVLAAFLATGATTLGSVVVSEGSLASTYPADDVKAEPRIRKELEACGGLDRPARMYSDGLEETPGSHSENCVESPPSWMALPEPEPADLMQEADAPTPTSSTGKVTAALGWATVMCVLLSFSGTLMASWTLIEIGHE